MKFCNRCGMPIEFISRFGRRPVAVDPEEVFFVEDSSGEEFVLEDGETVRGREVPFEDVPKKEMTMAPMGFRPHYVSCGRVENKAVDYFWE